MSPAVAPPDSGDDPAEGEWLASDDEWSAEQPAWSGGDEGEEIDFPIADYDDLTVDQIMPLLPQLYSDELDVVESREMAGQGRPEITAELARLREEGTLADGELDPEAAPAVAAAMSVEDEPVEDEGYEEEPVEDEGYEEEPVEVEGYEEEPVEVEEYEEEPVEVEWYEEEPVAAAAVEEDQGWADDEPDLPIEGYDALAYSQIVALLGELDDEELTEIRAHEAANKGRQTVLADIDRRLGAAPAPVPTAARQAPAAPPPLPLPAKKTTPRKAAAGKKAAVVTVPAKKVAGRKVAAVVTVPAKKAAAKKAAVVTVPAKKAVGRKVAAVVTVPAKKAVGRKVAAVVTVPAKKAAGRKATVKKAPTKKAAVTTPARRVAAPAKKVTKKR
ncbi:MAG: hypothetical protein H0V33_05110 [Acidimicrobiia bacterium]|nr:hypothetical protein [Acidimicrobiia bacterium]